MRPSQRPVKPNSSGYFTGRSQVGSKGVDNDTLLFGRQRESEGKAFLNTLSRLAFIIRHPKIYLRQRKEDRQIRQQEINDGKFQDTRNITDRKITRDHKHMQAVTRNMQSRISKDHRIGYDPQADDIRELEHVQKVRVGFWDDVPGLSKPKTKKQRDKLDRLKAEFDRERKELKKRNASVAKNIKGLKNDSEEIKDLEDRIETQRSAHNEIVELLIRMDDDKTDVIYDDNGVKKTRAELNEQRVLLRDEVSKDRERLAKLRVDRSYLTDQQRENDEVMEAVHNDMVDWMQSSEEEYQQLLVLLEKFPSLVGRMGGKDVAAKMAKGDQLKRFRVDVIGDLEQRFLSARGNATVEKKLGRKIYVGRMVAMRMGDMIRGTDTPEALREQVEKYTGKKLELPVASDRKVPLSPFSPFAYKATNADDDNWGKDGWENGFDFPDGEDSGIEDTESLDGRNSPAPPHSVDQKPSVDDDDELDLR
ncbi:hypothetical protein GZ77_07890 [Endozoicomonas montiporae]|uniref:Uncharacterized protein n=2 Tax=Endozoicomonas montiporae TaxID=1027273 RepID=A0A081N793_9GAMM|nr:hypothetical protein [Endozoicomonas montiporae]AMO55857.1 hypothetical protein EZMO1_1708 [Endozoicomonas montiporae CL-33]KEQ14316.1 hypothetical protein GZ77_07890 [Endozoicomonas montiporae]